MDHRWGWGHGKYHDGSLWYSTSFQVSHKYNKKLGADTENNRVGVGPHPGPPHTVVQEAAKFLIRVSASAE